MKLLTPHSSFLTPHPSLLTTSSVFPDADDELPAVSDRFFLPDPFDSSELLKGVRTACRDFPEGCVTEHHISGNVLFFRNLFSELTQRFKQIVITSIGLIL